VRPLDPHLLPFSLRILDIPALLKTWQLNNLYGPRMYKHIQLGEYHKFGSATWATFTLNDPLQMILTTPRKYTAIDGRGVIQDLSSYIDKVQITLPRSNPTTLISTSIPRNSHHVKYILKSRHINKCFNWETVNSKLCTNVTYNCRFCTCIVLLLGIFRRLPCPSATRGHPCASFLPRGCPTL
jgi:hypothetical protein